MKVWDLQTGREIRTLSGHGTTKVAISPDGKQAVVPWGDRTLKVWDLETGIEKYTISEHGGRYVCEIAFSQNTSQRITADFDSSIKLWDLETGEVLRTFMGHKGPVNTLAIIPERNQMISGSEDGTLKLWDLNSKVEIPIPSRHQHRVNSIAIIPNSKQAVSNSQDDDLKVWDLETGKEICTLMGHRMLPKAVAVSPDGKWVVSGCMSGTLKFWDLTAKREIYTLSTLSKQIQSVTISPNAQWLVSGSTDRTVKIWDLEKGKQLHNLIGHRDFVNVLAITPDSKRVISGSMDRTLKVWDLESGTEIYTLIGHTHSVENVVVTPDGKQAISKSHDSLKIWDLKSGVEISDFEHIVDIGTFVVLPDDKWIVFSAKGDTLKIWNWQDGKTLASLAWDSFYRFAVTDDAKTVVVGDNLGQVHVLRLEGIENFSLVDSNLSRKQAEIENRNLAISSNNLSQAYNFLLVSIFCYADTSMYKIAAPIIFRGHQGNENRNICNPYNLALLYNLLGGHERVEALYFQVLEDSKQKLGAEHPTIATILNNISNFYASQEKYKEAESYYHQAKIIKEKNMPLPGISNTKGWTHEQLQTRIVEVKFWLDWDNTTGSAKKWWEGFENGNTQRLPLILRVVEELANRRVTITEFYQAYLNSDTDNIQANLDYLDYTHTKKEKELRKKATT